MDIPQIQKPNTQEELKRFLDNLIVTSRDKTKVDAIPLPCGIGKSTYIRSAIAKALQDKRGLIVITDSVDRMDDYANGGNNEQLTEYINCSRDYLSILKSDTVAAEYRTLHKKPVVLMTTQRYFSLTKEEILDFTVNSGIKRETIIFDEKPYLLQQVDITIATLNSIDSTIQIAIDDTANQSNKQWLVRQWHEIRSKIEQRFNAFEAANKEEVSQQWQDAALPMCEDDSKFLQLVDTYSAKLNAHKNDTVKQIQAVYQVFAEGATIVSCKRLKSTEKNKEYQNRFRIIVDNRDKLIDIGAKVFVLDGTADVSPDYQLRYINLIDCTQFRYRLDALHINIINVPTGKKRLLSPSARPMVEALKEYVATLPACNAVFSYKSFDAVFSTERNIFDYFGNIKGKNCYREYTDFVQIGLNRLPNIDYEQLYLLLAVDALPDKSTKLCSKSAYDEGVNECMERAILADLEQNIFRSKIRNIDCSDQVTYTVIFNTTEHQALVEMIKERYCPLGATVKEIETPALLSMQKTISRKASGMTVPQKILNWINTNPGRTFHVNEMCTEIEITKAQFRNAKRRVRGERDNGLQQLFESMATSKLGVYAIPPRN